MNFLSSIFSGGAEGIISGVGNVVDKFVTTGDEKNAMKLELEKVITARMAMANEQANTEMTAKSQVLQSELASGDNYTRRARPTIVYAGLFLMIANYCIIPLVQQFAGIEVKPFALPSEFWMSYTGITATWSIGRSMEKRGSQNKAVKTITGGLLG